MVSILGARSYLKLFLFPFRTARGQISYPLYVAGVFIPNTLAALLEGISFAFILGAFSFINEAAAVRVPLLPMHWVEGKSPTQALVYLIICAVVAQLARSALSYAGQMSTTLLASKLQKAAQEKIYKRIFTLSFPCVHRFKSGELYDYVNLPAICYGAVLDGINRIVISLLTACVLFGFMLYISIPLALFAIVLLVFTSLSQRRILRSVSSHSQVLSDHVVDFTKDATQNLYAMRPIHTFAMQGEVYRSIHAILHHIYVSTKKLHLWKHALQPLNEFIGIALVGACLIVGPSLLPSTYPLLATLLTFITVTFRLASRSQALLYSIGDVVAHKGSLLRIRSFLEDKDKEFLQKGGQELKDFHSEIVFDNVSLVYPGNKHAAIDHFSLTIPRGKTIAFVGHSGAGKSSLVDLLVRLYDPTEGHILWDGASAKTFSLSSLRSLIGVVSQDTFIFNQSIEDNIRFGNPKATHEQVQSAAKIAGAHSFITSLSSGYATVVGERGYRLSGGERQRIAIARALVRNPKILILDEATSSLDSHSEKLVQDSIEALKDSKTILIVAHRLATVVNADLIVVVDKGTIIEQGKHQQLLSLNGRYAQMWKLQSDK